MPVKIDLQLPAMARDETAALSDVHAETAPMLRRGRLEALTGLRFIAAMQVVVFHFAQGHVKGAPTVVRNLVSSGYTGVSLFFVLSGFILAYNYLEVGGNGRFDVRSFWVARVARIYPVYALGLLISLPFFVSEYSGEVAIGRMQSWPVVSTSTLLLLQSWIPGAATVWNGPGWSLSVEAFFYLCFPLAAVLVRRTVPSRIVLTSAACWLLAMAVPVLHVIMGAAGPGGSAGLQDAKLALLRYNPVLHLPEFLMGMLAAKLYLSRRTQDVRAVQLCKYASLLSATAIVGLLCISDKIPLSLLHNGLLAPLYVALMLGLSSGEGPITKALSYPLVVLLGEASYATYILHVPLALMLREAISAAGLGTEGILLPGLYALVVLVVPVAVLIMFERPARRAIRARLVPRAMQPPSIPARVRT